MERDVRPDILEQEKVSEDLRAHVRELNDKIRGAYEMGLKVEFTTEDLHEMGRLYGMPWVQVNVWVEL